MTSDTTPETSAEASALRLPRVTLDLKIPLWQMGMALGTLVWALVNMWFTLAEQTKRIEDLQISVKSSNATTIQLATDQALLKYRVEKLEADLSSPKQLAPRPSLNDRR